MTYSPEQIQQVIKEMTHIIETPIGDDERKLVSYLDALPTRIVTRINDEQLAWMRMKANQCHQNAVWYANKNPTKYRAIHGWIPAEFGYMCHSVVEDKNSKILVCLTPGLPSGKYNIVVDPYIRVNPITYMITRKNKPNKWISLRRNPIDMIRNAKAVLAHIENVGNLDEQFIVETFSNDEQPTKG